MRRKLIFGVVILMNLVSAHAATLVCGGTIVTLAYHSPNRIMLRLSSMDNAVFFCNTDTEWSVAGTTYTTAPRACGALYSSFLSAKMSGLTVNSMYFDGNEVPATCDSWGKWKSANIRYFNF